MNILVIGCDQVGASLIRDLERIGHDISLIERDPEQLKRLDAFDDYRFGGTALVGRADRQEHLPARKGHLPGVRPALAGAVPQGLRAGDRLPHGAHRAGRVPGTGQVSTPF